MTKDEAKEAYRQAWSGWCLTQDPARKCVLEQQMDSLQSHIARGPGPEWQAFAETLPGFLEFWENWGRQIVTDYKKLTGSASDGA